MILISYPFEGIPKARPRLGRNGTYTPRKTVLFEQSIRSYTRSYLDEFKGKFEPISGPVNCSIHFYLPKPKSVKRDTPHVKPDLDNLSKGVLDAISSTRNAPGLLIENDSQVVQLKLFKEYAPDEPKIILYLEPHRYGKHYGRKTF